MVLFATTLVVLFGMSAFVIDIGRAYFVQRSLQAKADAAAAAGAQELPEPTLATAVAEQYSGSDGQKNAQDNMPGVTTTVTTKCLSIAPCNPVNAVEVKQRTEVDTFFARVLGFDTFTVHARATARARRVDQNRST